jgi:roadblock/LC7 domain-containing protein
MTEVKQRLAELVETETPSARLSYRTRKLLVRMGVAAAAVVLVTIAVVLVARRPVPPLAVAPFEQIQVTTGSGLASYPAVSSDGKFIAYASESPGKADLDIWVQHWDQQDATKITRNQADEYAPSFTPDGAELVYRSEQDGGGLYKISVLGGDARLLALHGRDGRFSPDGQWLAYWTGEVGGIMRTGSSKIFIMPSNGGPVREFPPGFDAAAYPVWSATEDKIIFLGRKRGEQRGDWWIADLQGIAVRATGLLQKIAEVRTTYPVDGYFVVPAVWLPNNNVLFTGRNRDATNIWAVRVNPDGTVPEAPYRKTDGTDVEAYPSAAMNAKGLTHMVYAALTRTSAIWRIPLNSAGRKSGDPQPLISGFVRLGSPSLSADGRLLAFANKQPKGTTIQIADLTVAGTPAVSLLHLGTVVRPVLSGDGSTVAWVDKGKGYIMAVKGDAPEEICPRCGPVTHLNLDGTKVIFEGGDRAPDGGPPIDDLVLCARGEKPRSLLRFPDVDVPGHTMVHWRQAGGRFSPDGRWVAFSGWHGGDLTRQILVAPVTPDGAVTAEQIVRITDGGFSDLEPVWSPQGNRIYFLSNRDGSLCVWGRDVDPKTARPAGDAFPIAHFHTANRIVRGPAADSGAIGLSASRDFLVLTLTDTKGNIWSRATR